jgi:hypothetical protein
VDALVGKNYTYPEHTPISGAEEMFSLAPPREDFLEISQIRERDVNMDICGSTFVDFSGATIVDIGGLRVEPNKGT